MLFDHNASALYWTFSRDLLSIKRVFNALKHLVLIRKNAIPKQYYSKNMESC